ncbi:MAG: DUF4328 domain-containing protein [Propioniciclava sp.]|uniref:DUF4328 domain-containing protein n=1 Tax=Propioniciclava sp. TaxID=2038686 RepID=UPI0039E5C355
MTATSLPQAARASEWPAPAPVRLRGLSTAAGVLACLHALVALVATGASAWRLGEPPAWLTDDAYNGLVIGTEVSLLIAGLVWVIWQFRAVRAYPPGTPRHTPWWHVWSWLIPVGAWWLPYRNLADLFRCAGAPRPRWMIAWWLAWVLGAPLSAAGRTVSLMYPGIAVWLMVAGGVLLAVAAPLAFALLRRLSSGRPTDR